MSFDELLACLELFLASPSANSMTTGWRVGRGISTYVYMYTLPYGKVIKDRRWWVLLKHAFCI